MLEYFHFTLRNILQWNFNRNSDIFIQENAFESVVCEMAAILSRPQCVNSLWCSYTTWHHLSGSSWVEKMTNHYPNQWWLLVKWVLRNQHQWKSSKQNKINFHLTKCIWKLSPAKCRPVFLFRPRCINSSPLGQNGRHFADDIFRCIFVNEKSCILTKISLKFVPMGPIDNNPALVQIIAWCRIGDKPLSEPMLTRFTDAYMRH